LAGFIWGAIFGRYVGYHQGSLHANRKWLAVVTTVLLTKCPPAGPCDNMPKPMPKDDERMAGGTNGKLRKVSKAAH
jgi:hypothetical protein